MYFATLIGHMCRIQREWEARAEFACQTLLLKWPEATSITESFLSRSEFDCPVESSRVPEPVHRGPYTPSHSDLILLSVFNSRWLGMVAETQCLSHKATRRKASCPT